MRRMSVFALVACCVLACGKSSPGGMIDDFSFAYLGGTLFSAPPRVTLKQIHLDEGNMLDKVVIVEGTVHEVSPHETYLVLSDGTARMLIVLTGLTPPL